MPAPTLVYLRRFLTRLDGSTPFRHLRPQLRAVGRALMELDARRKDAEGVAGVPLAKIPRPGTDAARLLAELHAMSRRLEAASVERDRFAAVFAPHGPPTRLERLAAAAYNGSFYGYHSDGIAEHASVHWNADDWHRPGCGADRRWLARDGHDRPCRWPTVDAHTVALNDVLPEELTEALALSFVERWRAACCRLHVALGDKFTRAVCVCGHHSGGPVGTPTCSALATLMNGVGVTPAAEWLRQGAVLLEGMRVHAEDAARLGFPVRVPEASAATRYPLSEDVDESVSAWHELVETQEGGDHVGPIHTWLGWSSAEYEAWVGGGWSPIAVNLHRTSFSGR